MIQQSNHLQSTLIDNFRIKKVIFVSGKLYYDLEKVKKSDTALIRLEEIAPFPWQEIREISEKYLNANGFFYL